MAELLAPGLWRLEIPLPGNPLKTLNSYLITGERNLLIDTGFRMDACRDAMLAQLEELQVCLDKTDIFLTHLHTDHCGLAGELHRPGCHIYISEIDGPLMEESGQPSHWEWLFASYLRAGFPQTELDGMWDKNPAKSLGPLSLPDCMLLPHGEILRYGGRELEVIHTPGHSPGHLSLYDRANKTLLCGDHVLFHITPNITRWRTMGDALGTYLESLYAVRGLDVELLCPAHRLVEGTLRQRCDELLAHHAQRIEDAYKVVESHPGSTAYDIAGLMRWEIRSKSWADFPGVQKWFAVGEALSHLDYLQKRRRIDTTEVDGRIHYTITAQ